MAIHLLPPTSEPLSQSSKEVKLMAAIAGKYVKNFSYFITSGIRIPLFPFSRILPSPFSSTIHRKRQLLISTSLITQFSSSSSPSPSPSFITDYTSAKYLSVRIRCRKDIVVSFNSSFAFVWVLGLQSFYALVIDF